MKAHLPSFSLIFLLKRLTVVIRSTQLCILRPLSFGTLLIRFVIGGHTEVQSLLGDSSPSSVSASGVAPCIPNDFDGSICVDCLCMRKFGYTSSLFFCYWKARYRSSFTLAITSSSSTAPCSVPWLLRMLRSLLQENFQPLNRGHDWYMPSSSCFINPQDLSTLAIWFRYDVHSASVFDFI